MVKRSGSWYAAGNDVITIINLQKSQYSRYYYLNMAFWLRALGEATFPKENHCHVRFRAEWIVPVRAGELSRLLDLEDDAVDHERAHRLIALLDEQLGPFLDEAGTLSGLRRLQSSGTLARGLTHYLALPILEADRAV